MGKTLVIAEKPSVAGDIARALGGFTKKDDFFESENYIVSSAVGHLLEICPPEGVEPARGKWSLANLPVLPQYFDLQPQAKTESRLKLLLRLMKRKDVTALINACDAGREGELIFRHIVHYAKSKLPLQRLWLQSMTKSSIQEGFQRLRTDGEMQPLAEAAVCRSEADWLVGINGTRAITAFNSRGGGFQKTTVGRVQTPTLTMIVEREESIRAFVSRAYYELHGTFSCAAGAYEGVWFNPSFVKDANDKDSKADRIWKREEAEEIQAQCVGKPGTVREESKKKTEISPLLYDLTSLQREANQRYGFPARRTLQIAQALYEKHKVLTYPRTDSRALPKDYLGTVRSTMGALGSTEFAPFAERILQSNWIRFNKRIFNNAKISDHFAIIPTGQIKKLDGDEARIYDLVTRRFLAVFFPPAEYLVTTRITQVESHSFKTEGKVMVEPGWTAVYGREANRDPNSPSLVPVNRGESVHTDTVEIKACETKPPARFTEATLLSAMETAGKFVDDEELRDAMSEKGLGTPATRAAIIEGLITENYMQRSEGYMQRGAKSVLIPTAKAFDLIALLRGLELPELCSPELTGDWEFKLKQIEQRQMDRAQFMEMIRKMTSTIVEKVRNYGKDIFVNYGPIAAPCPKCGAPVNEEFRTYKCTKCDFSQWKTIAGRRMMPDEVSELFQKGTIGPLDGFRSKMGRPFSAALKLNRETWKTEFDFGDDARKDELKNIDFSTQTPLGKCPICGSNVYETENAYLCEHNAKPEGKKCGFRMGRVILSQTISHEQLQKLLTTGKTDLLTDFFSEKKKKKFSAYLVTDPKRGTRFEFESRSGSKKTGGRGRMVRKKTSKTKKSGESSEKKE